MEASESMQVLARAGRSEEAVGIVQRAAEQVARSYDAISSDDSRTAEYKRAEMDGAYENVRAKVAEDLERLARTAREGEQRAAAKVFGTAGLSGDPGSLAISRRDAADRVESATTQAELRNLLERANRVGDEVLARAVAEKAFERQDADILNTFLESRPHLDSALQSLWDAQQGDSLNRSFAFTMELAALRPPGRMG